MYLRTKYLRMDLNSVACDNQLEVSKIDEFHTFIDKYNCAKQGSSEWTDLMKYTFGGSELHRIVRAREQSLHTLALNKHNNEFKGNLYTLWGSLFEDIAVLYLEIEYKKVWYTDVCLIVHKWHRTSPDGFIIHDDKKISLVEIKCPYKRIPTDKIPDDYVEQVFSGIDICPLVDDGLFCDFVFRTCTQFDFNSNNLHFRPNNTSSFDTFRPTTILAKGTVTFIGDSVNKSMSLLEALSLDKSKTEIQIQFYNIDETYEDVNTQENSFTLFWKLFDIKKIAVQKKIGFIESILPRLNKLGEILLKLNQSEDPPIHLQEDQPEKPTETYVADI
jgi:hypothetical protein